jgi:autoinducer 2 (AI-2) kinase
LLVVDAGTGSGRAVLFDLEGRQRGVGQQEWRHVAEPDAPGSMTFDTEANWPLIVRCIGAAMKAAGVTGADIRAISTTSMREGIVLYDKAGKELWACANVDSRAEAEVRALKAREAGLERDFYLESGQTFALGALPRLDWVKAHRPHLFERVRTLSMINDWAAARLSGEIVVEPTNGGTSGLMSLATRDWSDALIARAGLDRAIFPRIVEPGARIGAVTASVAAETGLRAGTPVIAGGGDVQLGTIGLGIVRAGNAAVLGGTFWQQVINIPNDRVDPNMRVRINPAAIAGLNQAECISFFVGMTMRWFRDAFCAEEVQQARATGADAYDLMEAEAAAVPPGAHGVIPIFSDAMDFGRWYHAAPSFLNLSLDSGLATRAVLFRALEENAAIVSAVNLERVREFAGGDAGQPLVFAGGASKGRLWSQILADVTGREVRIPIVREATSLGAAAAAALGIGEFADFAEAADALVRWERSVTPNRAHRELYDEAKARWQQAYAVQKGLVDAGITTAMWSAPGALEVARRPV